MKSIRIAAAAAAAVLAAGAAGASTIYSNGPINGTVNAFTIDGGFQVADSFTVGSSTHAWDMTFGTWNLPGDKIQTIDWSIWNGNPFGGGTMLYNGTANVGSVSQGANGFGYNLYSNGISLGGVSLGAGTYWVELSNAVLASGNPVFWDDNNGPSAGWQGGGGYGDLSLLTAAGGFFDGSNSEAFSIGTPEPATWALMLTGIAGLGAALRARRKPAVA